MFLFSREMKKKNRKKSSKKSIEILAGLYLDNEIIDGFYFV